MFEFNFFKSQQKSNGSRKNAFALTLLVALWFQMFPPVAAAQSSFDKNTFQTTETVENVSQTEAPRKIALELEENIDSASFSRQADDVRRVIVRLKSETSLDETSGDDLSEARSNADSAGDVKANKLRSGAVREKLTEIGGKLKKSFDRLGLVAAELPLSKIRQLAESDDVAYISPDNAVVAAGHLETTTGANLVRNLTNPALNGNGIGVAVLDSGVYGSHKLIEAATSENRPGVVFQKDFTNDCTDCWDTNTDVYGHGTHVATMINGRANVNSGYYTGVAPNAKIISLKVLDNNGAGVVSNVVAAIDWAIANKSAHNIRVINISLGTPAKDSYKNDPLCLAARRAVNAGIVVVASAGNNGKDTLGNKIYGSINSPGIEPSVITVGAANTFGTDTRADDQIASFSSRGSTRGFEVVGSVDKYDNIIKPDLVAPGNKIIGAVSTYVPSGSIWSVNSKLSVVNSSLLIDPSADEYSRTMYMSGTSVAAPVVAGAVALMLQARPNLTPNLVKAILQYTAQPIAGFNTLEQGAGMLNVDGAVRIARIIKTTLPTSNGTALLSASLPASQSSIIAGQTVYWGRGVLTNYGFLYGDSLMSKYQKIYDNGVLMADGTPVVNGVLTRSASLTSNVTLYSGANTIGTSGIVMGDSRNANFITGAELINNVNSSGIVMGDGVLMGDGIIMGDSTLAATHAASLSAILGENTSGMTPAP